LIVTVPPDVETWSLRASSVALRLSARVIASSTAPGSGLGRW
jgi:hypothetical protein